MVVGKLDLAKVQLKAGQIRIMNHEGKTSQFKLLGRKEKDLIMFTITDLKMKKSEQGVIMYIRLKRKIQTEMTTTYFSTSLLLVFTLITILFPPNLFEAALGANLTIMLVIVTLFTSKIEELPPTSDVKMIDLWLLLCVLIVFAEMVLRTIIEIKRTKLEIRDADADADDFTNKLGTAPVNEPGESEICCNVGAKKVNNTSNDQSEKSKRMIESLHLFEKLGKLGHFDLL